jgi:hypothetical protein
VTENNEKNKVFVLKRMNALYNLSIYVVLSKGKRPMQRLGGVIPKASTNEQYKVFYFF